MKKSNLNIRKSVQKNIIHPKMAHCMTVGEVFQNKRFLTVLPTKEKIKSSHKCNAEKSQKKTAIVFDENPLKSVVKYRSTMRRHSQD